MTGWLYLAFGYALFLILERGGRPESSSAIWIFVLKLSLGLILLLAIDTFMTVSVWTPSGRSDLRLLSIFLWCLVIEGGIRRLGKDSKTKGELQMIVSPFFLTLLAFSLWTMTGEGTLPWRERFLWGLGLPVATGFFQWLVEGLRGRLRLAPVPEKVNGAPLLFWLAMLLGLAFGGVRFF